MNRIKNIRKRSIGTLVVLLIILNFMFTPALLFSNYNFGSGFKNPIDEEQNLNLSTNYLFQGTAYTFNLDDFYDDENLYKVYTGAKFQTEAFNGTSLEWSGVVNNDTVTPVDNDEVQYGESSGVYNGTYSFENDDIGGNPAGFTITETGGTVNVIAEKDGHNKVLEFYDDDPTYRVDATNEFATIQIDATIEFWWAYDATETLNHYFGIYFKEGDNVRFQLFLNYLWDRLGSIQYRDSTGYHPTGYYDNPINNMVHIKLEFDDTNNVTEFIVDGVSYGELPYYTNSTIGIDNIFMFTRTVNGGGPYWHWIDAIGYKTEVYHATYGFDDQPVGTSGSDIDGVRSVQTPQDAVIIGEHSGHKKVLNITWETDNRYYKLYFDYISPTSGTIESWIKLGCDENFQWQFMSDVNSYMTYVTMYPTVIRVYHDGGYTSKTIDTKSNWVHMKLQFDYSTYKISFWINGELIVGDVLMHTQTGSYLYKPRIQINTLNAGHMFLDAVGYSWDPDYNIGDNLEGWDKDYDIGENLYPDNINMIEGSYDYTDNMKVLDDSYTTFTSTEISGLLQESPEQWDNFTFTKGSGNTIGELETNDNDYAIIDSESDMGSESNIIIEPDADIQTTGWTPTPLWSRIDGEDSSGVITAKADVGSGDAIFRIANGSIPANNYVTRINLRFRGYPQYLGSGTLYTSYRIGTLGSWSSESSFVLTGSYPGNWFDNWFNDLWSSQLDYTDIDDLQVRLRFVGTGSRWNHINVLDCYIYYASEDFTADFDVGWNVTNPEFKLLQSLKYGYKTTNLVETNLSIYNWDTTSWLELESNNETSWITDSYTLSDPYINDTNGVNLKFETSNNESNFDLYIDQLCLEYFTISPELEMEITFPFANYNEDLLAMNVQSWQKTNKTQVINFSIWNFDTESWIQISSSSDTSFTKKEYNTTSPANFISPSGVVKLNWTGSGTTNDFELHIDYLFIQIFYKLDLIHSKSFDTNGIYRYRWVVLGSIYYTQWVTFEVVDPVPNFHAISESDVTTRWILQGNELTPVEDFNDDITGSNWDLDGVAERIIHLNAYPTDDTAVNSYFPNDNFGAQSTMSVLSQTGQTISVLIKYEIPYLAVNYTTNSTILSYLINIDDPIFSIYETSDFNELSATWNNQPATGNYIKTISGGLTLGWDTIDIGRPFDYIKFVSQTQPPKHWVTFSTKDWVGRELQLFHHLSKNYLGSGYMYMQTNITETVALKSTDYGTHYTLNSGDYFEVDFQTNSDSQINLILLKDGVVNKTLTLSQSGNTNFNNRTVQISVDETVEFDQVKISSTFEDTDNMKVYDIKTKKYTITGDSADFRVSPKNDYSVYLTPNTYNLRIFEEGSKKIDTNITIGSTYNFYIYEPTANLQCRLTLFSTEGDFLNFEDYHIKINRSLNGEFNEFWLVDTIFYADEETYVYIEVFDRFDGLIDTFEKLVSSYIDLELGVYQLQIKNLQTQKTTVDINSTHTYPLLSEESIYFMLAKDYYQIGYYDTNNVYKQFLIYLDSNQAYELNRSKICFLAYVNQKGEHLYFDDYKTYINDSLIYENVFYREIGDDIGIEVKDIYGISIKNQSYTVVSGDNYIPVVLTMYSLKVMNQQEQFNHINITRDPNYYESGYYWSEWIAPNEIIKFRLFPGYYKINLTDNEGGSYSFYEYTLNGDDILLISSDNILSQVIYNIANVNTTIGNQITNVEINITNQNSEINNTVVNIEINLSNVNSTLGDLLTNIDVNILNLESDIASLYTFTNTSIWNLNNAMNTSFIYMENNIYSINQSISTLVIGIDNSISLLNATIVSMFTEMNQQFITVQSTLNYSFSFLNQTIIQLANNITENHVVLYNLIEQRANEIDSSLIDVQTLINLVNNTVADESLVIQTLVNLIGANITSNHIIINNLLNLIDNNITNNNIQLVSILEIIGNNITSNHFVIQTLLDVIGNNITYNHIELLTNLNLINTTISQNQIELINRLLFINNTMNDVFFELTNQLLFLNGTIYSAVLNLSTSVEFGVDMVIGNITLTYQQNEFLTELYKETMFSQLLNWSDVAYNYTLMEDRIDVWEFINNYRNDSVQVLLRYNDLIDNLTVSAQNTIDQYLPKEDVEYRLKSVATGEYLSEWEELPENRTVSFGFFETEVPFDPEPIRNSFNNALILIIFGVCIFLILIGIVLFVQKKNRELRERDNHNNHKLKPTSFSRSLTD